MQQTDINKCKQVQPSLSHVTQVQMMRDVLQLMEEAKNRHKQVLAQLQEVPPRQSDRLKIKPKKDYKKFDKFGY